MTQKWMSVCALGDLSEAKPHGLCVSGTEIILVRHEERVFALGGLCPHDHALMCYGQVRGETIICPRHGATFRLEDGGAEPGFRLANLASYATRLRGGQVQLRMTNFDPGTKIQWDLTRR